MHILPEKLATLRDGLRRLHIAFYLCAWLIIALLGATPAAAAISAHAMSSGGRLHAHALSEQLVSVSGPYDPCPSGGTGCP